MAAEPSPKVIRAWGQIVAMICLTTLGIVMLIQGTDTGLLASVIVGVAALGGVNFLQKQAA